MAAQIPSIPPASWASHPVVPLTPAEVLDNWQREFLLVQAAGQVLRPARDPSTVGIREQVLADSLGTALRRIEQLQEELDAAHAGNAGAAAGAALAAAFNQDFPPPLIVVPPDNEEAPESA